MTERTLPPAFAHLQSVANIWSLPTERERHLCRLASSMDELDAVHETLLFEIEGILAFLNRSELDTLSVAETNLFHLALSLAEIAPAVLFFREPGNPDGFDASRFIASQ